MEEEGRGREGGLGGEGMWGKEPLPVHPWMWRPGSDPALGPLGTLPIAELPPSPPKEATGEAQKRLGDGLKGLGKPENKKPKPKCNSFKTEVSWEKLGVTPVSQLAVCLLSGMGTSRSGSTGQQSCSPPHTPWPWGPRPPSPSQGPASCERSPRGRRQGCQGHRKQPGGGKPGR